MNKLLPSLAFVTCAFVTACGGSASTSPNEEAVITAVMSQTFGPWEDARSGFSPDTSGATKWDALLSAYRLNFSKNNVGEKKERSTSSKDGWLIYKYCNVADNGDCNENGYKELHLRSENGDLTDLRYFTGSKDGVDEHKFYGVRSEPFLEYSVDIKFEYAIQDQGETCLLGSMELPAIDQQQGAILYEGFYTAYQMDATVATLDGISLEPNFNSTPGIIDRSATGVEYFDLCVDYEAEQLAAFGLPEGDLRLQSVGSSYTDYSNSQDIFIVFEVTPL
jgi:hypothetical protein